MHWTTETFASMKFEGGKFDLCLCTHARNDINVFYHGDHFVMLADETDLQCSTTQTCIVLPSGELEFYSRWKQMLCQDVPCRCGWVQEMCDMEIPNRSGRRKLSTDVKRRFERSQEWVHETDLTTKFFDGKNIQEIVNNMGFESLGLGDPREERHQKRRIRETREHS